MNPLDQLVVGSIRQLHHSAFSVALWQFITHLATASSLILMLYLVIFVKDRRWIKVAFYIIGLISVMLLVEALLKPLIARPRPFLSYNFEPWIKAPHGFSMPSGHSTIAFYNASYAALLFRTKAKYFLATAALIAFSRLYLGVHYLSDVTAGALLGLLFGYFFFLAQKRINKK